MARVLVPVGIPVGPHYTPTGSDDDARWQIGLGGGLSCVDHRVYAVWAAAFAGLDADGVIAACEAGGLGDCTEEVATALDAGLLVPIDPAADGVAGLAVLDRLSLVPRGVGAGNPGPDGTVYRIVSQRHDVTVTCSLSSYWAYFGSQRRSIAAQLQAVQAAVADGDTGPAGAVQVRSAVVTEVFELMLAALPHGLVYVDLAPRVAS